MICKEEIFFLTFWYTGNISHELINDSAKLLQWIDFQEMNINLVFSCHTFYKACQFYVWCRILFEKKSAVKELIYSNLYSAQTNFCKVFLTLQKIQDKQRDRNHVSLNHGIYLCSSAHKLLLKWRVNDINLDIHSNHPWVLGFFALK